MLIQLNYELAVEQAGKIQNTSVKCGEIAMELEKQRTVLEANWTGNSAAALIARLSTLLGEIKAMESTLGALAGKIRSKADQLKAIDDEKLKGEGL